MEISAQRRARLPHLHSFQILFHLLSIRGTLHALGGGNSTLGGSAEDVEEFVEETGTWKPATSLSGKRSHYGGVAVNLDLICG